MLTFIPWVSLVLQKKESFDLDGRGTLPGLCHLFERPGNKQICFGGLVSVPVANSFGAIF